MTPETESIYEKIRKLLALAESSNENEAAVAAAKAADLLAKYNLDQSKIPSEGPESDPIIETRTNEQRYQKRVDWVTDLADVVAQAHFCRVLYRGAEAAFIGHKRDVEVAVYTYNNLMTQLQRLVSAIDLKYVGRGSRRVFRSSWLRGAVYGIGEQYRKARRGFVTDPSAKALVAQRSFEVDAFVKQQYPKLDSFSFARRGFSDAWGAGKAAGETVTTQAAVAESRLIKQLS